MKSVLHLPESAFSILILWCTLSMRFHQRSCISLCLKNAGSTLPRYKKLHTTYSNDLLLRFINIPRGNVGSNLLYDPIFPFNTFSRSAVRHVTIS